MAHSLTKITPFLMFEGQAEEAMNYYVSIFDDSEIINVQYYGPNESGEEGTILHATFSLNGQEFMCIDSSVKHEFSFTPAISFYLNCGTEEEITLAFDWLSEGGSVLMPLASYPFSQKFAWVSDKFGVTWQLNLVKN
ncbi:VOC family protein [Jeotgalibacillus proteolyticus]|uniref:VOC family protein n=1 Tax=Jeotgalibacillus proteolyticus TaxID=2082395 RepID=UPI003CEFC562